MKIKLFPKGYDPVIASGPPTDFYLKIGLNWKPEDTQRMLLLEQQASVIEATSPPIMQWYEQVD